MKQFCRDLGKSVWTSTKSAGSYLWGKISIYWKLILEAVVVLVMIYIIAETYNQTVVSIPWRTIGWYLLWITGGLILLFGVMKLWERMRSPDAPDMKKFWKPVLWVGGVVLLAFGGWKGVTFALDSIASREAMQRAEEMKREGLRRAYCKENIWAEGCAPSDTIFSRTVVAGSRETIVIPPGYRLDWWDSDGCASFITSRERVPPLVFRYFETARGVERTTLTFHLYKPRDPNTPIKTECNNSREVRIPRS